MMIRVKLMKSPIKTKKFRVMFEDGRTVDFGGKGYSDFTLHREPRRMRFYVRRHGGKIPKDLMNETNSEKIYKNMKKVTVSDKEDWSDPFTAGFWSRWLLWSEPSMAGAKKFIEKTFSIKVS
jgi:hypothetical protein